MSVMASSGSFLKQVEVFLDRGAILKAMPLSGGDINEAYRLTFSSGQAVFLKCNGQIEHAFFEAEADGLTTIAASNTLSVPTFIGIGQAESRSFLALEYLESSDLKDWQALGDGLAKHHQCSHDYFGGTRDNFIGSLTQKNIWAGSWSEFYTNQRILPQVRDAFDKGLVEPKDLRAVESFLKEYPHLHPKEEPALLHGDLWSGNVLFGQGGKPHLIDPSVYYGHREIDLAMMHLFGGFPKAVYETYDATFPLVPDWEGRLVFHQLYPLLVHLNLFGLSYRASCRAIWQSFA